jgi:hypothetical protein
MRSETREQLRDVLGPTPRNLGTVALVVTVLVATHAIPTWGLQYAGWLLVFSLWMTWFVLVVVEWLALAEE